MSTYVELQASSHHSLLRGASSPNEWFAAAATMGHTALGLADWNTVGGAVRAWDAQKATGVRLIAGAQLQLDDGRAILVYTDRPAWSRLTRLLSLGKSRAGKGGCDLDWADAAAAAEGQVVILLADLPGGGLERQLGEVRDAFGDRGHLALCYRRRPGDRARPQALAGLARAAGVRAVATGDVLFHSPDARILQDVVTAIRERTTIDALGFRRERHADRHLKSPGEMERRFGAERLEGVGLGDRRRRSAARAALPAAALSRAVAARAVLRRRGPRQRDRARAGDDGGVQRNCQAAAAGGAP